MRGIVLLPALAILLGLPVLNCPAGEPDPFGYFIGHWTCHGQFVANNMPISATIAADWDEHTMTLTLHHDDVAPHGYHAVETWGATKTPGYFHNSIADRFSGVRWYSSHGWQGDSLAWSRTENEREIERFVYTRHGERNMTVEWLVSKGDAAPMPGDMLECKKD